MKWQFASGVNRAELYRHVRAGLVCFLGRTRVCGAVTARHAALVFREREPYSWVRWWCHMELHRRVLRPKQGDRSSFVGGYSVFVGANPCYPVHCILQLLKQQLLPSPNPDNPPFALEINDPIQGCTAVTYDDTHCAISCYNGNVSRRCTSVGHVLSDSFDGCIGTAVARAVAAPVKPARVTLTRRSSFYHIPRTPVSVKTSSLIRGCLMVRCKSEFSGLVSRICRECRLWKCCREHG
jgi:hypothetical protein